MLDSSVKGLSGTVSLARDVVQLSQQCCSQALHGQNCRGPLHDQVYGVRSLLLADGACASQSAEFAVQNVTCVSAAGCNTATRNAHHHRLAKIDCTTSILI